MGVYLGRTPVSMYIGGIKEGVNRFPTALTITHNPNKTEYQAGETLNLDGLEVTITWSDNTIEVVTDQCTFSKNTGDVIYEDTTQVIITWKWAELETINYTNNIPIKVNKVLIKIAVTTPPSKINYKAGEQLSLNGIVVTATYNSGKTENVTSQCTFTPSDNTVIYESTTKIDIAYGVKNTSQPITVTRVLSSITLTSQPTTLTYQQGATLNLSGMVVQANYNSGAKQNVTGYTTSPAAGSKLNTLGSNSVTVSYSEGGVTKTTSFNITVNVKTVAWTTGSDADVANMISAAHQGLINLEDYWAIGDTRTIILDNKNYNGSAGNMTTSNEQVQLVLAEKLSVSTSYGKANGFIVTTKNCLKTGMMMNLNDTNTGLFAGSDMCAFLNDSANGFLGMLPDWLANNLLTANVKTADPYDGTTIKTTQHKIFLPTEREIFGAGYEGNGYLNNTEAKLAELKHWKYYQTTSNRVKQVNGSNSYWWERSPSGYYSNMFCIVRSGGDANISNADIPSGVAPCAII